MIAHPKKPVSKPHAVKAGGIESPQSYLGIPPTVLVVDDDGVALAMLEQELKACGYPVLLARDGAQALHFLRDGKVRIVLSDWIMPQMDGLELCRHIKSIPESPFIYFIMLTALDDPQRLVEAFSAGVNDFLSKPCEYGELMARLHAGRNVIELESELVRRVRLAKRLNDRLRRLNSRLEQLARTDSLTGLFNRREAMSRLREHWQSAERYKHPLCVAMIDVDHFKQFNDSRGHQAGDDLLRLIAAALARSLREADVIARVGGDEFLVAMPHTDGAGAAIALERVRDLVRSQSSNSTALSIGIASNTEPVDGLDGLLGAADARLYAAKQSKSGQLQFSGTGKSDQCSIQ